MTPEEVIAALEASNAMADHLDALKVNLETRGWSTPAAEQASTVITNTMLMGSTLGIRR